MGGNGLKIVVKEAISRETYIKKLFKNSSKLYNEKIENSATNSELLTVYVPEGHFHFNKYGLA
jgi:hypothetical protein